MAGDLVEQNNHDIKENDDIDGIFVSKIYKLISSCFMWNDYKIETHINEPSFRKYQWNCCNCGNVNFCAFVDSKINTDLGKCNLCGMTQKDAIMCNLRNYNTFVMETNYIETKNDSYISDEKLDEIDKNIKHVITSFGLDLICLNQNNNNSCKSIIRLAKCLIQHKEWVDRTHINVDDVKKIYKTINIDIKKHTDNDTYQDVIIECLKSFEKISNEQSKLFREHFGKMEVFFKICNSKKLFTKCVKEQTHIKPAVAIKLFNQIKASLMVKAHKKQFGTFLTNLKIDDIENDYNHILKHHIYGGSDETKKTVFVFFQNVVHYTDKTTEKNACKSYKRHQLVAQENKLKSNSTNESEEAKNKYVWTCTSKQYYIQKQLDVMHSYLAHSDLKRMMEDSVCDYKNTDNIMFNTDKLQDKDKYISYSFGIGHEYPHLSPLRDSIRDELSYNSVIPLGDKQFQDLLIKAINKHKYELKDYQDTLFCKYFNPEYNILRNEPIGIRHILALVVYTDLTQFCTVLRGTYRPKDDNEDEIGVTERHRQFYWYSRTLYESVESFGQEMKETLKVFHGLKGCFQFDQFAAFFNQPVSTSKAITVAQLFAGGSGGAGIILTLTSRSKNINDLSKVPKYLSVSWLSDHSHEEELLYYGSHVSFKIENITEIDNKNRSHQTELSIFNKFQSTVQNEYVKWNKNEISNLVKLIQHKIHNTEEKALFNTTCITDYGIGLFHNFCVKMTHISIKNFSYKKIPKEIFNVLFDDIQRVSFINLVKLFPNLEELCFNDLVLSSFVRQSKQYVEAVLDLLNYLKEKDSNDIALHKIQFESVKPIDNKKVTTLQKLAYKSLSKLKLQRSEWRIKYRLQETHKLIFRDYQIIRINDIKDCNQKQMIYLVQQICNESDKLWPHKQLFVSYFKQNKIDGTQFVNSGRVEFVECMVNANSNLNKNKMSKQISKLLVKGLKTINETLPSIKEEFVEVNEDFSDVENALKEEQDKSVVLETTIYDLRKKIEELERQNQKPLNEQSMVASDTWYKRQIDMDDIDEGDIVNEIKEASTNNSCGCIISFFDKFKINKSKRSKNQSQIQFNLLDEQ